MRPYPRMRGVFTSLASPRLRPSLRLALQVVSVWWYVPPRFWTRARSAVM